jgi:hypothetical protein
MTEMMHADEIFGPAARLRQMADRDATTANGVPPLADILHDVQTVVRRYVVLNDAQTVAVTLWVAHTHAIAAAEFTPYLQVTSATAESGKTRVLDVLRLLVLRPWFTGRVSAAVLVRKIDAEHSTLLLDESDAAFSGEKEYAEALRGILNTGYQRNGTSSLCVGQGTNITYRDFSTFSPKAIAGIGKLPDTVTSRAIRIELKRRAKNEAIHKFRERDARIEAAPIHQALIEWSRRDALVEALRAARPVMPAGLRDRAEDVVEPLLAIADLAGGDWPQQARQAVVALMGSANEQDVNVELLHDIFDVFQDAGVSFMPSDDLVKKLSALDSRPWGDWKNGKPITTRALADRLKAFGIEPKRNAAGTARGYYRERFEDAWARYPRYKPSNRQSVNGNGAEQPFACRQTEAAPDASKTQEGAIDPGLSDGLTLQTPSREDESDVGLF